MSASEQSNYNQTSLLLLLACEHLFVQHEISFCRATFFPRCLLIKQTRQRCRFQNKWSFLYRLLCYIFKKRNVSAHWLSWVVMLCLARRWRFIWCNSCMILETRMVWLIISCRRYGLLRVSFIYLFSFEVLLLVVKQIWGYYLKISTIFAVKTRIQLLARSLHHASVNHFQCCQTVLIWSVGVIFPLRRAFLGLQRAKRLHSQFLADSSF